jgi:hypothetical protein
MFKRFKFDRRQGYSFLGHVRRVIAVKGTTRVAASLGGTALIAAIAFAHCSSSSVTGPKSPTSAQRSAPSPSGPSKNYGTTNWLPPVVFTLNLPHVMLLPIPNYSPCTHQAIVWDLPKSYSRVTNYLQSAAPPDPSLRSYDHVASWDVGVTDPASLGMDSDDWRRYKGYEEHDTDVRIFATGAERYKEEWDVKILAYGNRDQRCDADDFYFHYVLKVQSDPTKTSLVIFAYCKDSDYGWWKNDPHYYDDD